MPTVNDKREESKDAPSLHERAVDAAAAFMSRRGCEVVEKSWECEEGTVDLIAEDPEDGSLHFIGVNCTDDLNQGFPIEEVDAKRRAIWEMRALRYLKDYERTNCGVVFDGISMVVTGEHKAFLRLHTNVFGS